MGQKSSKQPRVDSRYLAPQKPSCFNEVDLRKLRRLIKDRKLAPCYPGLDSESRELEECPICFLKYPSLNRAVCCHKPICTECFLQVKSLKPGYSPACPYCKADFSIYFQGPASTEQRLKTEAEDKEQAYALERSRQGEQEESSRPQEQQLPAVPYSPAPQSAPASLAKLASQASSAEMHLWDYLPHELLMAEAVHFEVDLDEAMLMQGISASLEQQASQPPASSSTSRIHSPLDDCHPLCTPPQLESDAHAAQQACRDALGPAQPPAQSKQPKLFTGPVIAHSSRSQEPTSEAASSTKGAGAGLQMDSGPAAAAAATLHSSAGSNEFLLPPSGSQSDGIVHLSVTSPSQPPASEHSTATYVLTSTSQLGPPSRPVAAVSSPDTPPQSPCDSQHSSSTSQGRAVDSLPQSQCCPSGLQRSSSAREGSRVQATGTGDTLAGFLQQQAKAAHVGTQASLPQPASGAHELRVGMVLTDFTIVPSAGQHYTNSSCSTGTQYGVRQSVNNRPDCPVSDGASASMQGSVEMSGQGSVEVVSKQERGDAESVPHSMQPGSYQNSCEMQEGLADLTNGAVMMENPDGSVQYVVLTSDEQRAVQLSMQAKRNKDAETAEGSAYQVEGSPEDQAVQAAIVEGDAILRRLYQVPQAAQEHPSDACCAGSDVLENTARGTSMQHADPMLSRIEEADARLRLLYSSS